MARFGLCKVVHVSCITFTSTSSWSGFIDLTFWEADGRCFVALSRIVGNGTSGLQP